MKRNVLSCILIILKNSSTIFKEPSSFFSVPCCLAATWRLTRDDSLEVQGSDLSGLFFNPSFKEKSRKQRTKDGGHSLFLAFSQSLSFITCRTCHALQFAHMSSPLCCAKLII